MKISDYDLHVLSGILSDKRKALEFVSEYDAVLFQPDIWNFVNTLISYIKTYKVPPTLNVLLDTCGKNTKLAEHITECWDPIISFKSSENEYPHYLDKLKKRFAEKQILSVKDRFDKMDYYNLNPDKIADELQKNVNKIKQLNGKKTFTSRTLKSALKTFTDNYNAKAQNPNMDVGVPTGYSFLDYSTDGLKPGELLIVGAESGGGKSLFLMNLAMQMWLQGNKPNPNQEYKKGYNVLYFSLEMPFEDCMNRFMGCLSELPSKHINKAKLSSDRVKELKSKMKFISQYPNEFEIVDIPRGVTIEMIESIYEEKKLEYNPDIVVIDYLGLMELDHSGAMDDHLKLGKISEKIHEFARVHKCIVLTAVQLNRMKPTKDNSEERVGLHRVGRSAMIMHNANIGIQIETRQNEHSYPDMLYHIIKCRNGVLGMGILDKNLAAGRLTDTQQDVNFEEYRENIQDISEAFEGLLL